MTPGYGFSMQPMGAQNYVVADEDFSEQWIILFKLMEYQIIVNSDHGDLSSKFSMNLTERKYDTLILLNIFIKSPSLSILLRRPQ